MIDGEHYMNYCEDNNCKHYGNKEQCEKTHCYYRCYSKLYTAHKAKERECENLKSTLRVIANRPCLNMRDCNGNCLPHCKWNAHKLAQEALKELE